MHMSGACSLYLSQRPISVSSEARSVTLRSVSLFFLSPVLDTFLCLIWKGERTGLKYNFPKHVRVYKLDKQTGGEFRSGVC